MCVAELMYYIPLSHILIPLYFPSELIPFKTRTITCTFFGIILETTNNTGFGLEYVFANVDSPALDIVIPYNPFSLGCLTLPGTFPRNTYHVKRHSVKFQGEYTE